MMAAPPKPALAASSLGTGYGKVPVLQDVTVEVRSGEIVAIVGPNGAGKTTLMRALSGELPLVAGKVHREGVDVSAMSVRQRLLAGVVHIPEHRHLFRSMTILENLELGIAAAGLRKARIRRERLDRVLSLLPDLAGRVHMRAESLSGGQQQMLAIGRGLMSDPEVLLLDEPSLGLAPAIVRRLMHAFVELAAGGAAVLLVEQHVESALEVATRGYVLRSGQVRLHGEARAMLADHDALSKAYFGYGRAGSDVLTGVSEARPPTRR